MENNVDLGTIFVKCEDKVEKEPAKTATPRIAERDRAARLFGMEKGAFDDDEE